jgi:tRNA (guanine-N7-)-methyltransferase
MEHSDIDWQSNSPDDWHKRPDDWPATRYELKALEAGRLSAYMTFLRKTRLGL